VARIRQASTPKGNDEDHGGKESRCTGSEDQVHPREPGKRKLRRMKRRQMLLSLEKGRERGRKAPGPSRRRLYMHKTHIPPSTLFAHECVESRRCIRVHPNSPADLERRLIAHQSRSTASARAESGISMKRFPIHEGSAIITRLLPSGVSRLLRLFEKRVNFNRKLLRGWI